MDDTVSQLSSGTTIQSATLSNLDSEVSKILKAALEQGATTSVSSDLFMASIRPPSAEFLALTSALQQDALEAQRRLGLILNSDFVSTSLPLPSMPQDPICSVPASLPIPGDPLPSRVTDILGQLGITPPIGASQTFPTPTIALAPPQAF